MTEDQAERLIAVLERIAAQLAPRQQLGQNGFGPAWPPTSGGWNPPVYSTTADPKWAPSPAPFPGSPYPWSAS